MVSPALGVNDLIGPTFPAVLEAARAGDGFSFGVLFRALQPPLLRYLRVLAGDAGEDLASETWLEVARSLDRFDGDESGFRAWMFTIARHRHLDWCRRNARRPARSSAELPDIPASEDVAGIVLDRMSTNDALELIGTLSPDQAEAVALRVIADLDVGQVAEIMERQPGAVRVLAHRGLRRLADRLDGAGRATGKSDDQCTLARGETA